jgi:citrate lyase beta subunit
MTLAYPVAGDASDTAAARARILDRIVLAYDRAAQAAELGMAGKLVGHPLQLLAAVLAAGTAFDAERLDTWVADVRAYADLQAGGTGVGLRDGAMVDVATDRWRRSLLRRAVALGRLAPTTALALDLITPDEAATLEPSTWSPR